MTVAVFARWRHSAMKFLNKMLMTVWMETGLNASALQPIGCSVEAVATMIGCLPTQALAFSPVSIQTQCTQCKRLRLDGNRALGVQRVSVWHFLCEKRVVSGWCPTYFHLIKSCNTASHRKKTYIKKIHLNVGIYAYKLLYLILFIIFSWFT